MQVTMAGRALMVLLLALLSSIAFAQDDNRAGFQLGETTVYPAVRMEYVSVNNVFNAATNEQEATAFVVKPEVDWVADRRLLALRAHYAGNYSSGSEDVLSFADHEFNFGVTAAPGKRLGIVSELDVKLNNRQLDKDPAQGRGQGQDLLPITDINFRNSIAYGAEGAKGNITVGLDFRNYIPDDDAGLFIQRRREYLQIEPYVVFSLRVSPDTRLLVELRTAVFDYAGAATDSTQYTVFGGVAFSQTGVLGGAVKVGYTELVFDSSTGLEGNTVAAQINLFYRPLSYSTVDFRYSRNFDIRSSGANNEQQDIRDNGSIDWRFSYSDRFSHRVLLIGDSVDRDCKEVSLTGGLEFNLAVRRWLEFGVGVVGQSRTTDGCVDNAGVDIDNDLEFESQRFIAHLRATL
jgi:hypothetical protein